MYSRRAISDLLFVIRSAPKYRVCTQKWHVRERGGEKGDCTFVHVRNDNRSADYRSRGSPLRSSSNLARIPTTASTTRLSDVKISETDVIAMKSFERPAEDVLFDCTSRPFFGQVRHGTNPLYARPTAHLRLSRTVNWVDATRSTKKQYLNPQFMTEWSEALIKDR